MRTASLALASGVYLIGHRSGHGSAARPASLVVLGALVHPLLGVAAATVWILGLRRRRASSQPSSGLQVLAGALVVGAAAGLSLQTSLKGACGVVDSQQRAQVERVLRDSHQIGLGAALAAAEGSAAPLFGRLARAQVTGAPLIATVAAFAAEERANRRALGVEAARKLPVKLTIPLALLVLPGFLLLTAAPAAVGSIQRLLGPLLP